MDNYNPYNDITSGQAYVEVPDWSMFNAIRIHKNKRVQAYNDRGGNFFNYLVKSDINNQLKNYLKRLQVFDSVLNEKGEVRNEFNDCCFIYSLLQSGKFLKMN